MEHSDARSRSFSELVIGVQTLAEELVYLAKRSESERELFSQFACHLEKFIPILVDIREDSNVMDMSPIRKALESIKKELFRAKTLINTPKAKQPMKQIEGMMHDLGRSLGLVLFATVDLELDVKEKIGMLRKELMNARFEGGLSPSQSPTSGPRSPSLDLGFLSCEESGDEIEEDRKIVCVDDIVLQLKYGEDEEFKFALFGLRDFIMCKTVSSEWINEEGVITILLNRLDSSKPNNHLTIIQILRTLALEHPESKEKMADTGSLSALVKSLTRDADEQREAIGLLLDLSDLPTVWRQLGRIQGCIVMLVAILNGDDPVASHNAGKLLNALSSNTQNALHMAEAGYFKPLVKCLKEGSEMSKILMAKALSKMELTDQSKAALGKDGAIGYLVKMFNTGKLEAKLSALSALQNLSSLTENIQLLIRSGIVVTLLQLLFSVTSVLMTLREPASAILARIAQSESILVNQDVAEQMLSLLSLSSPVIQYHLLQALGSIAAHSSASKVRRKMNENGAFQLLLPFLTETNVKIRTEALNLMHTLFKDLKTELTEQLTEAHLAVIVNIISSSTSDTERVAAVGILSSLPVTDKKATDTLKRQNLLPILISTVSSTSSTNLLLENVAELLIRFTIPSDKKLQLHSVELGVIPALVKLLSTESVVTKLHAATSLSQLSQNTFSLRKSRKSMWFCVPPSADAFCEIHDGYCFVKNTFCLLKAGAISPLIRILEGKDRGADVAVLSALATLLQDEIWEDGSNYVVKISGVQAIIKVLESGNVRAQEKALWILERVFRVEKHRIQFGESAQVVLIDLAQNGDARLRPKIAMLLAQLDLLQEQSSYF